MEKLNYGDKIFLDKQCLKESDVNNFLNCRDGIVEVYEYRDSSGYGSRNRLFRCENTKHESIAIIRQTDVGDGKWVEESMFFDSDSFAYLEAILSGNQNESGGKYSLVRDYSQNNQ